MSLENNKEIRIGVIHAAVDAIKPLNAAITSKVPNAKVINLLNENMLQYVNKVGAVDDKAMSMFSDQISHATQAEADVIIVACNVFASHVKEVLHLVSVPLLTVDSAMQEMAVTLGKKIGIIGTNKNAVPSCYKGIKEKAQSLSLNCPEYIDGTVIEAAKALTNGDIELFDTLVYNEALELVNQGCDVIVLAQVTLARAKDYLLQNGIKVPILTSPESCADSIKRLLENKTHE